MSEDKNLFHALFNKDEPEQKDVAPLPDLNGMKAALEELESELSAGECKDVLG